MNENETRAGFRGLNLIEPLYAALEAEGYEDPTPIQARTIPSMLAGKDVIGQAQTGTGKTAAFALPILSRIDLDHAAPQVLVLTPTRELAIQVSEAFHRYASKLKDFRVLPIYGGQEYGSQLRRLKRGVHVVVGTPGRVMDHMNRGTLKLDAVSCMVLDEADEMLRMGFIDDVDWILGQTPPDRQIALFSATIPPPIRKIAKKYMKQVEEITVKEHTVTVAATRQRFRMVGEHHKLDALTRILEFEPFEAVLIFVRTRTATLELAEKLEARGYPCAALNGDISQNRREQLVAGLKDGKIDILVATDVAARGLDVERVSHVINYDVPNDTEAYIHRIGRTGRAGRSGEAIVFVTPRERRMLSIIEKVTRQKITELELPTTEMINDTRIARFKQQITDMLSTNDLGFFRDLVDSYLQEHDVPALDIAAALAKRVQGDIPMLLPEERKPAPAETKFRKERKEAPVPSEGKERREAPAEMKSGKDKEVPGETRSRKKKDRPEQDEMFGPLKMEGYRLEVGLRHGVKPGNIVGAIVNETGIEAENIGRIDIQDDYSTVDLPEQMPAEIFHHLKTVWVSGQQLQISKLGGSKRMSDRKPQRRDFGEKRPHDRATRRPFDSGGRRPQDREKRPFDPERKRFGDRDRRPFDPEGRRPQDREKRPFDPERKRFGDRETGRPFNSEGKRPQDREKRPFDPERKRFGDRDRRPFDPEGKRPQDRENRRPYDPEARRPQDRENKRPFDPERKRPREREPFRRTDSEGKRPHAPRIKKDRKGS